MEIQNHWAGNNDADTDVILTLDDIYAEHTKITENFIDISKNKPDIAELQAEYEKCIRMISDLYTSIKQLNNVASAVKGEN
jgi:hypothetical protein